VVEILLFAFLVIWRTLLISNDLFHFWPLSSLRRCAKSCFSRVQAAAVSASMWSISVCSDLILPARWYYVWGIFQLVCSSILIFPSSSGGNRFVISFIVTFQVDLCGSEGTVQLCTVMKLSRRLGTLPKSHRSQCGHGIFDCTCGIVILLVLEFKQIGFNCWKIRRITHIRARDPRWTRVTRRVSSIILISA